MKAFVTGGTGFIGRYLVQKLVARGYEVVALVRSEKGAADLTAMGAQVIRGDITDIASMRPGIEGSDVVFHLASWYKLGTSDWLQAEAINVGGTRKVLRLAYELGVPKIIYTSTVNVFGDTRGQLVDENFYQGGPFLTEYDRTKWLAHYKVALPLIEKGAPIIIVMPGPAYGPGDPKIIGQLMHLFHQGLVPILPGPETTFTYTHVADVAEGHILAAERGKVGESYVLAGPAIPLGEMIDFWAYLAGRRSPAIRIPARFVRPLAPVVGALRVVLPLPQVYNPEIFHSLGVTYMARADKARAQLGWQPRSLQTGMIETLQWVAQTTPAAPTGQRERQIAALALGTAAMLLLLWFLIRRRK